MTSRARDIGPVTGVDIVAGAALFGEGRMDTLGDEEPTAFRGDHVPAHADRPLPPNPIKDVTDDPRTALPRR